MIKKTSVIKESMFNPDTGKKEPVKIGITGEDKECPVLFTFGELNKIIQVLEIFIEQNMPSNTDSQRAAVNFLEDLKERFVSAKFQCGLIPNEDSDITITQF